MRQNKYAGKCHYCHNRVGQRQGLLIGKRNGRWAIAHNDCHNGSGADARVSVTTFSSGQSIYRNVKGRCEDAPCCGCCS
jgi:hypothetical protein